jgi:hypothetical protein
VSEDGRIVAFDSQSQDLVPGDTNVCFGQPCSDVFVRDRDSDENGVFDEAGGTTTARVSVGPGGVEGDSRTIAPVVSGGAGRYYDRLFLSAGLDERFKVQYPTYRFQFSATGCDPAVTTCAPGVPLLWKESYLSRAALDQLIAAGTTKPEVFLVNNDTKPPYSDQWNIGYRQSFGQLVAAASYNVVRGYRGFSWGWGGGHCCLSAGNDFGVTMTLRPVEHDVGRKSVMVPLQREGARHRLRGGGADIAGDQIEREIVPGHRRAGRHKLLALPGDDEHALRKDRDGRVGGTKWLGVSPVHRGRRAGEQPALRQQE